MCHCHSLSCSFVYLASGGVPMVRVVPYTLYQVLASIFSTRRLLATRRCVSILHLGALVVHCHSLTLQKVLRSRLVIGWCRQLASCVLSLARRGSYGSGALPALVALMSVCVCDLRCWWHGMAAVCVRHSDVSVRGLH